MRHLLAAELLKQSRQRSLLFWGFLAVPIFMTLIAFVLESAVPRAAGLTLAVEVHPIRSAMRAAGVAGNPIAQLFFAIGAAAIFGVEYRHAAWRHIVPRAGRTSLLTAKLGVFALLAGASLLLVLGGDVLASLVPPLARGVRITDAPPATLAALGCAFLVSFGELLALGGTVALMAVLTRSTLGAVLPPFLLAFTAAGAEAFFLPTGDQLARIPLPTCAADALRSWLWAQPQEPGTSGGAALLAAAILLAWIALSFGAALLTFRRQDLSAE
jgi:hypothetical protein